MGDFYEIFFDDAVEAAPIMGVTLTSRPMKEGRQPMCGVPHHSWQGYVGKLLRAGRKVVICDQVEEAAGQKLVKREITRVLTPGTVVDDAYLEPARSNWLVAAWARGAWGGLAACDVSTGELLLCQLPVDRLQSELDRLAPAELLQPPGVDAYRFDPERGRRRLSDQLGIAFAASVGADEAPLAIGAAGVVLEYLEENQVRVELHRRVRRVRPDRCSSTRRPSATWSCPGCCSWWTGRARRSARAASGAGSGRRCATWRRSSCALARSAS
jgi:DNA mismatch repair protein MutS